ncbi:hypothetical protein [Mangrovicoccus ximenensis]|uniref:hypothetical protein n=1 Tax=Mangrovicoccus ximenensis TaxID=1911570 RepID=UPI000D37F7C4|nr:hypothetical protein [Mangrovicoccus ximenensis]
MSYSISRYVGDISSPLVRLYVEFQVTYSEAPFPETLYDDPVYGTKFGYTDPDKYYVPLTLGNAVETVVELGEYRYGAYNDPGESSDWTNGSPDGDWMGMDYYKTEISAVYTFPTEAYLEWLDRDWMLKHPSISQPATFWQTYYITGGELSRLSSPEPFNLFHGTNPEMRKAEAQLYLDQAKESFGWSSLLYELPGGYRTVELDTSDDDLAEYEIPYLEQTVAGAALMLAELWLSDRGHSGLAELAGTISALDALGTSIEERFVGPRLELIGLMASEDGELADYATIAEWEAANGLQAATLAGFIADNGPPAGLALASVSLIASEGASGDVLSVFGGGQEPASGTDGSDRAIFGSEGATFSGGMGRDYLAGGSGSDHLRGGASAAIGIRGQDIRIPGPASPDRGPAGRDRGLPLGRLP